MNSIREPSRFTAALGEMNGQMEAAKANLLNLMSQESQYRNLHQNASTNRESLKRRLRRTDEEEAETRKKIDEAQDREGRAQGRLEAAKTEIARLNERMADTRGRLDERSKALGGLVKKVQGLDLERNTVRSKYSTLKKMEDNFEWYKDGVKAVMKHAKPPVPPAGAEPAADGRGLDGVIGLVADVLAGPPVQVVEVDEQVRRVDAHHLGAARLVALDLYPALQLRDLLVGLERLGGHRRHE